MSSHSKITDEEMKYFQFKAKQHLLIKKEDHEWNEFCKLKKCTCCSCQPLSISQPLKDVGIQVSQKTTTFSKRADNKSVQNKDLPESLKDIRTMLEKIDISLSEMKKNSLKNTELKKPISSENMAIENNSVLNFLIDQKKHLIKKSLMSSLQRLHSVANNRPTKPLSPSFNKSSNKSFFLPHDLQRQRIGARNAYLASLTNKPKLGIKESHPLGAKKNKVSFENKHNHRITTSKPRRKNIVHPTKPKEPETLIQSETISDLKDENVENIINNIVDDLLGDELLTISSIKQKKAEMQHSKAKRELQINNRQKEDELHEVRTCIKQNPFFDLKTEEKETIIQVPSNNLQDFRDVKTSIERTDQADKQQNLPDQAIGNIQDLNFDKDKSEMKDALTPEIFQIFTVDPELVKNVTRQRKSYWQYLHRISRTKTFNFDPSALSNMVAESLLDDCIIDVCEELGDVPASLIKDLINQEFIPTL